MADDDLDFDTEQAEGEAGDANESKHQDDQKAKEGGPNGEGEHVEGEHVEGEHLEDKHVQGEHVEGEHVEGEHVEGEYLEGEHVEDEHVEGEHVKGEHVEGEHVEGEYVEGEHVVGEHVADEQVEGEHAEGEKLEGEQIEVDQTEVEGEELIGEGLEREVGEEAEMKPAVVEQMVEEEEAYVEEPPPDPAAPFNFSDSQELIKEPFELRPGQLAEVEMLWGIYQNYTPAYTDIDNYITEKELIYMLKCLLLMTYTPEQTQELIDFCVRPPHPKGHISYDQFLKMVMLRQRDLPIEEELRSALQIFDPDKTGILDRDYLKEILGKLGNKLPNRFIEMLVKEVDITNDGTLAIEDIISTMVIDLNKDDIILLRKQLKSFGSVEETED